MKGGADLISLRRLYGSGKGGRSAFLRSRGFGSGRSEPNSLGLLYYEFVVVCMHSPAGAFVLNRKTPRESTNELSTIKMRGRVCA